MPAVSEKQLVHLAGLNSLPQTRANGFRKGCIPYNKGTKVMLDRECEFCSKPFQIAQSALSRIAHRSGHFCSRKCMYASRVKNSLREKIRPLYEQGKAYKEIGSELNLNPQTIGSQVYRMKIADRYGDGIFSTASKKGIRAILRDDYGIENCELCGYERTIEIAHVLEQKNGGDYLLDNCLLLCPNCHHLFDHKLLDQSEIDKLKKITRLNGNLARRLG